MIFVTVGTTHFDALISEIDNLLVQGIIRDKVYAQIGLGTYIPQHAEWTKYLTNIEEMERKADLVICHGGVGSVFELLKMEKDFIAVANPSLANDHQSELLRALDEEGWCTCCFELRDLGSLLEMPRKKKHYPHNPELPLHIWSLITSTTFNNADE